jgi:hypothetical protein
MSNKDVLGQSLAATSAAKLPALVVPKTLEDEAGLLKWMRAATEHLQVREGQRGNKLEQVVTHRDLTQTFGLRTVITAGGKPGTILVQDTQGNTLALSGEQFADMIRGTRLYKDLLSAIDDPARFDRYGERVKALLLPDLAELAAKQGAAVKSMDIVVQQAGESFAARKTEITAAIDKHVAGIRETLWAEANNMIATAGKSLQITARLDDVAGSSATIEEVYGVIAGPEGLTSQYTLKLNAGGAIAGFGISADAPTAGVATSHMIFVADNFAFVTPSETLGTGMGQINPTSPGSGRIPFGISGGVVYINGALQVGPGGTTLNDLAALAGISISASSLFFKVDSTGAAVNTSVALGIVFSSGLSGTVTWSHGTGYGGSTPSGTNSWTVNASDQSVDAVTYTATITISGTTYTDSVTLVRLRDGTDALTGILSNEAQTVPADNSGAILSYTGAGGTFEVFRGSTALATPTVAFSYVSSTGFSTAPTTSINATTGVYSISANINAEIATVTYRATVGSTTLDKVFTITKVRQGGTGAAGTNAKILQILATSDIFSVAADGSTSSPTSITFSANGQNLTGSPTYAIVSGSGTATLSGGGGNVLQFADLSSESVQVQVSQNGLTDTVTVAKVHAGSHAITVIAPNQAHTLPADNAGTVSNYGGSGTTIQVFEGATALTYVTGTPAAGQYNISKSVPVGTVTTGAVSGATTTTATVADHSAMTTDVATVLYSISGKRADGSTFIASIEQTLTKSKTGAAGANGADSTSWSLNAVPTAVTLTKAGAYNPTTIAFSATSAAGLAGPAAYAGRFKIYESTDGSTWSAATYTSAGNESSKTFALAAGDKAVKCELYAAGGTSTLLDTTVVPILAEGTDAVTAVVANPAQTLPASSAGVVSSYSGSGTTIHIYEGGTLLTYTTAAIGNGKYTIGTPTVSPAGKITVGGASGNGTTTATYADHSAMDNATGSVTITYPVLVQKSGGQQVSMSLTQVITKAAAGTNGANAALLSLLASSQVFQIAKSGAVTPASITFSLNQQNLTGSPSFSVISGTATLTGTGTTRALAYADLTTDTATIQVTQGSLTDTITVVKVREGNDSLQAYLTNEAQTVPASSAGAVSSWAGASGSFVVFNGATDVSASCTFAIAANPSTLTATIDASGNYSVTASGSWGNASNSTYLDLTATYSGTTITKRFTIAKSVAGVAGVAGLNNALVYIYQRAASAPSLPSATTTYTFATSVLTGLNNGWSQTIPAGTNPLYTTVATASSNGTTDTIAANEWASAVIMARDGAAGLNVATVYLFKRTATSATPALPTTISTYTFATSILTNQDNGWTQSMPTSGGAFRWMTTATAVSASSTDSILSSEWAAAALVAQDGTNGTNGTNGTAGARGSLVGDGLYWGIRLGAASLWDDTLANRVIDDMVNGVALGAAGSDTALVSTAGNRVGDRVTLANGPPWQACIGTLNASGTWRSTTDYVQNQYVVRIVSSVPSIYRALKASGPAGAGSQDPNSTTGYWMLVGVGAAKTSWASTTVYAQYDYLTDSGTVYFANFRHTSGSTSLSTDETAQQVSITRTWNGLGWVNVVLYVDGNAVVTGTLSANVLYGGTLSGMGINIGPGAEFQVDPSTGVVTATKFFGYASNFGNTFDPTKPTAKFTGYPGGSANTVEITLSYSAGASSGVALLATSQGTASTSHAIRGLWNKQGTSSNPGRGTNNGVYASGLVGAANGNAFYAEAGTIGPFTGSHECVILNDAEYDPGDIVVDTECVVMGDLSNTLWHVERSSEARQIGAVGIIVYAMGPMNRQMLLAAAGGELELDEETGIVYGPGWFEMVKDQCTVASMNALGEGAMNVCGQGGLEVRGGDLIVTSSIPGKGMRLDPATPMTAELFACVVAKVRGKRSVVYTFDSATDWQRVPVIFVSG